MPKKIPQRMCVACRQMMNKKSLLRVVRTADEVLRLDPGGKMAGRGAYICAADNCLVRAKKTKALERALSVKVDEELWQDIAIAIAHTQNHL